MRSPIVTAFAIAFGLVVLIGYFAPADSLPVMGQLRTMIIDWAAILASFVTLVAIFGLVGTHWSKLRTKRNPDHYSIFVLIGFVAALALGVVAYVTKNMDMKTYFQYLVTKVQVPVETSLMALLAVTMTLAGMRLLGRKRGLLPFVFWISVLVFLLLNSGLLSGQVGVQWIDSLLGGLRSALQLLPVAGGRGILLGIALGSLLAGLRIILGADRPYTG